MSIRRRDFLKISASLGGLALTGGFSCTAVDAATITPPVVDKLSIDIIVDLTHNIFLKPAVLNGVALQPAPRAKDYTRELHTQWGLSLLLHSQRAAEARTFMLDYAYTPDALLNNFDILGLDATKIDALIVSHGHFDHYGGLIAFLFFLVRTTLGRFTPAQATAAIVVSYYWHFVDVVWIGLFATIYLIK